MKTMIEIDTGYIFIELDDIREVEMLGETKKIETRPYELHIYYDDKMPHQIELSSYEDYIKVKGTVMNYLHQKYCNGGN